MWGFQLLRRTAFFQKGWTGLVPARRRRGQAVDISQTGWCWGGRWRQQLARKSLSRCLFLEVVCKLERVYPPWSRSFGRTACGRADGEECSRRRGNKSLKCRHGDKWEDLQGPYARNSASRQIVAAVARHAVWGAGGGGHEGGLPAGREEDETGASQDGQLEELGSQARVWGVERKNVAGANRSFAAKKDQRSVDSQAPQCDEKTGCGRRMGVEKSHDVRLQMVSQTRVWGGGYVTEEDKWIVDIRTLLCDEEPCQAQRRETVKRNKARRKGGCTSVHGERSETKTQRVSGNVSKELTLPRRFGDGREAPHRIFWVEVIGLRTISQWIVAGKPQKLEHASRRFSWPCEPLAALCLESHKDGGNGTNEWYARYVGCWSWGAGHRFWMVLVVPSQFLWTTKDSSMVFWTGAMKCTGQKAKDVDHWMLIWEEVRGIHQEGMLLDVEHVKVDRSKKMKQ